MTARTLIPRIFSYQLTGHPWSARADKLQSATGLMLASFLVFHLHFESSILLGKEVFFHLVQILEGGLFTDDGRGISAFTQIFSVFMLLIVVLHAAMALRRFPSQLGQWRALRGHLVCVKHKDTQAWFWQLATGFILFFLVPAHLFTMILHPEIGPNLSAARVVQDNFWLLYALLLPAVVIHGLIGLYRVAVKWGLVSNRSVLRKVIKLLIIYLILLGCASLLAYVVIGLDLPSQVSPYISKI